MKKRRKSLNISQQKLAEQTNVSQKTISNIERGNGNASVWSILAIAQGLRLAIRILPIEELEKEPA